MRLIDADALKEVVNNKNVVGRFNTIQLIDNAPTITPDMAQVLAYECGKASAERLTRGWISVSERYPEIATRCIVQLSNGYITIGEYFSSEKWTLIETTLQFVYPKETVTAWMPLPQSYEKEI